jgi:dTDP-4-amino-4,6-dideoxygalactose transaminase
VLESGEWWYGDRVATFEKEFAAFQDAKHCITCTSGTTAAEIAMRALDIGHGDEVIVPPFTFVATASTVAYVGATPIFVDTDESWCMDPTLIEATITPRTKAIMPVHFGGRICDIDAVQAIADKHNLKFIEDACHSWGSKWKGKGTGALGHCGVFSFQASKNLNAGEGGAILTDDDALAERCRSIINCGRSETGPWHHHVNIGTNARLTEFAGALLSAQFSRLEEQNAIRNRNAAILDDGLAGIPGLTPQPGDDRISHRAYHLYCLRFDAAQYGCSRDKFLEAIAAEGIELFPGYAVPLYEQPCFLNSDLPHDYSSDNCPDTAALCAREALCFTQAILLGTEDDMQDIITALTKIQAHAEALAE